MQTRHRLPAHMLRSLAPAAALAIVSLFSLHSKALACACSEATAPDAVIAVADTSASTSATPSETTAQPVGHPLRGVIVDVLAAKQALLVKHEEIPGVMRAMTMMLKVDAPTLAAAKKGESITATLVRKDDGWWLENVKPVTPAEAPAGGQG